MGKMIEVDSDLLKTAESTIRTLSENNKGLRLQVEELKGNISREKIASELVKDDVITKKGEKILSGLGIEILNKITTEHTKVANLGSGEDGSGVSNIDPISEFCLKYADKLSI